MSVDSSRIDMGTFRKAPAGLIRLPGMRRSDVVDMRRSAVFDMRHSAVFDMRRSALCDMRRSAVVNI